MKFFEYLNKIAETDEDKREEFLGYLEMRNLASCELTETDMWILTNAATNNEYLSSKLAEEELTPAAEAPDESVVPTEEVVSSAPMETPTEEPTSEETPTEEPTSEETPTEEPTSEETPTEEDEDDSDIETSKEGIGVLALLGEIQEKLATGKPSPVEVAAIKALKKLVS